MQAVQHTHSQGRQADQKNVWKHDPGQKRRQFDLTGSVDKSIGDRPYQQWCRNDSDNGHARHHERDDRQHRVRKLPSILAVLFAEVLRENRNEGGAYRTLADKPPQKVRNPVSNCIGVSLDPCAQKEGDTLISEVAKNTADKGNGGNQGGGAEQLTLFAHLGCYTSSLQM